MKEDNFDVLEETWRMKINGLVGKFMNPDQIN